MKSTHDAYENTWKCGELRKALFFPTRRRMKKKKKNLDQVCKKKGTILDVCDNKKQDSWESSGLRPKGANEKREEKDYTGDNEERWKGAIATGKAVKSLSRGNTQVTGRCTFTLLLSSCWTSRGHRCRPFSPVLAFHFYRAEGSAISLLVDC